MAQQQGIKASRICLVLEEQTDGSVAMEIGINGGKAAYNSAFKSHRLIKEIAQQIRALEQVTVEQTVH